MKKSILAAGISLLFVFPGAAAEPTTLNGRMERVEDVLYLSLIHISEPTRPY